MIITRPVTSNFSSLEHHFSLTQGHGSFKRGQLLDAVALTSSQQGRLSLRIGDSILDASTSISLRQNAHLLLEVVEVHPQLLLRLVASKHGPAAPNVLRDALSHLLPGQNGLAPSLAGLLRTPAFSQGSPEQVRLLMLLNGLGKAIPERSAMVHAHGIRQAILYSGLFLEALLARSFAGTKMDSSRDIKACLLRLQLALKSTRHGSGADHRKNSAPAPSLPAIVEPPRKRGLPVPQPGAAIAGTNELDDPARIAELAAKTRGAAARLGALQAISAENFINDEYMWQLEIPVRHADAIEVVSVSIAKEHGSLGSEDNDTWVVNLAVDLRKLGAVKIRISLFAQGVSTCFWSESPRTRGLIESRFAQLESKLQQLGVQCLNLCCREESPAAAVASCTEPSNIDILA